MTTTTCQPAPSTTASRGHTRAARVVPAMAVGMLAALTACGGAGSASTSASASPSTSPAAAAQASGASGGGQGPAGTSGTVAASSASNAQVQNPTDGQVTVNFTPTTRFTRTVPATRASVTVGTCVSVASTSTASSASVPVTALTARSVTITPAVSGSCTAQAGGFGGIRGGGNRGPAPSAGGATPSPGAARAGNRVFGKVTSASAAGFVVQGRLGGRSTGTAADVAVTVNPTTTYTSTLAADKSAVTVGSCLTAIGPSDSTGAVTARSVSIRPAGPGGCTFGRRFGGATATGATGGGSNG